ncbi:MAG: sulfur carrier protein ThiS [SAR202 cluster bacterium]|nr:sulfur carrier protein ThiS [SAR202 cluster bacterium]
MINVTVNGKPRQLDDSTDLMSFLREMKVNFKFLAVGYNGEVLPKTQYDGVVLKEGDVLEVVRPIGGG